MIKNAILCLAVVIGISTFSNASFGVDIPVKDKERLSLPCEWCEKVGVREKMLKMKPTLQLLTHKLMHLEWDNVKKISDKLMGLYNSIDLKNPAIPADFFEFNDDFRRYYGRFEAAFAKKDFDDAEFQLKRVKTACTHCHVRYVRHKQMSDGIALERLYKDQFKEWGDGKSFNAVGK